MLFAAISKCSFSWNVEMDCYRHIEKFKDFCICAKAEKVYYTLKVDIVLSPSFSCTEIDKDIKSKVKLGYGISDILVGSEYAIDQPIFPCIEKIYS